MRSTRVAVVVLATAVVAAGCGDKSPSMLKTHGSEASRIAGIWWLMFGLGAGVYAVVAFFIVWAIVRGRRADGGDGRVSDNMWIVWGGVVVPVLILGVLAVVTVQATTDLRKPEAGALQVEVVGKRWWWQVGYPGTSVTTANEIRLPAGRQVEIGLDSDNVVHSFWVPQLAGKLDLIPGQHNILRFTPRTPGTYIGECAEFCGVEHARMGFVVIVQTTTDFDRWMTRHQLTPSSPDGESAIEGEVTLVTQACAGCHAIRGTPAQGTVGPDLTDFGERTTIGARTVPNTPENLAKWIVDAQSLKPGALMPPMPMSDREVKNVIAYLEGLK
ncbi:MAG: cytochrome c oxidase subunit [Actinomycetota bacterium]|nr:cytochrome c oxidase subunit [Actinomycetota bacterium]